MARKFWLDLFTGKTWEEFLQRGGDVSGFRERRRKTVEQIHPGDYLICYLTGLSRFVGVLEVKSEYFIDRTPIWEDAQFPYRLKVKIVHKLNAETAVPIFDLKDRLTLFHGLKSRAWSGFFRGSPALFDPNDAEIIVGAIRQAEKNPVAREYDEKKYWRQPKTYESKKVGVVTVPDEAPDDEGDTEKPHKELTTHEEIQWLLLKLGSEMGLDVWVARNDKNRGFQGKSFQDIPRLRRDLPRQFDEATNKTIELIDVLWLQGDAFVAAFEVEHSTSVYSGLLRMSDLVSMQPNIKLDLYLVAPDERREKVVSEINRPTFARLKPSLPKICKFIAYSRLKQEIDAMGTRIKYIKPEFIQDLAESCDTYEL